MKCYVHEDREAVGFCSNCGKGICQEDSVNVGGKTYCPNCLAQGLVKTNPTASISEPTDVLAVISCVCAAISLCFGGIFLSVPAGIMGYIAVQRLTGTTGIRGMTAAKIGMWAGIIISVIYLVFLLIYGASVLFSGHTQ